MDSHAHGTFKVVNQRGLHARAAIKLTQLAQSFRAEITLHREGQLANAKSVMGVLLLCASRGTSVEVDAIGVDAQEAVDAIGNLFASKFGEEL